MISLFVHDPRDLDSPIPGGVQLCSREFLEIVRSASDATELLPVGVSRAPLWRLRRRFGLGSYLFYRPAEARAPLADALARLRPSHVFLNRSELLRLAPTIRELRPSARIVVMSHGNQTGDDLYEVAGPGGRRVSGLSRLVASARLGLDLVTESACRHGSLDGVCVMSEEEETLERWLGARRTLVLPRLVRPAPLDWRPVPGRAGFVGTLDHTPNRVALDLLCARLAADGAGPVELRVAGGPEAAGRALAARYPFVRYIGRPDDAALRAEVSTWSLFLNPIFWLSRGASMKLGQALGWALPTLSTRAGARGYRLPPDVVLVVPDDPGAFVGELRRALAAPSVGAALRERLSRAAWTDAAALGRDLRAAFP